MPSKNHRIQFYADECIPIPSVSFLRKKGINVVHVYDEDLVGKSDSYQLNHSKKLGRVLLSLDNDFKKFDGKNLNKHPGVILITVGNTTPDNINRVIDKVVRIIKEDYVENSLIRITIAKIKRIKKGAIDERSI